MSWWRSVAHRDALLQALTGILAGIPQQGNAIRSSMAKVNVCVLVLAEVYKELDAF